MCVILLFFVVAMICLSLEPFLFVHIAHALGLFQYSMLFLLLFFLVVVVDVFRVSVNVMCMCFLSGVCLCCWCLLFVVVG